MSRPARRAAPALATAALAYVLSACLPMPPGSFTPGRFAPGEGPDLIRATTFQGLGAWWDVWDWSPTFTDGRQTVGVADVDRLAAAGVQALYVQTATYRHPADVLDADLQRRIIARAHQRGVRVVGWYLPQHVDEALDLRRMSAAIALGYDGFAVDIESRDNPDLAARNDIMLREVRTLRARHPQLPLAAVPVAPILWTRLNTTWWPNFPWAEAARYFDAWMPQNYWTIRSAASGLRDPYRYNVENIELLRSLTGVAWLPVHPIGGEAAGVSEDDLAAMYRAIHDTSAIGGSIYDDASTASGLYGRLAWFRFPK